MTTQKPRPNKLPENLVIFPPHHGRNGGGVEAKISRGAHDIAKLSWLSPTQFRPEGQIHEITVHKDYRRMGIATEMLKQARAAVPYKIHHSSALSPDAKAWIAATDPHDDNGQGKDWL